MIRCDYIYQNYLAHHGILGMHWGKRNGPPYPLDAKDHSASEKKAGWRKSLDKSSSNNVKNTKWEQTSHKPASKRGLTDKQKTALKVGVGLAVAGLAVYGAYKMGALDKLSIGNGKDAVDRLFNAANNANKKTPEELEKLLKQMQDIKQTGDNVVAFGPVKRPGFETLFQSLHKANPLTGTKNCAGCSIAGILRTMGYNVTSKAFNGAKMSEILSKGFKNFDFDNPKMFKNWTIGRLFAASPDSAKDLIKKQFGNATGNARGVVSVGWKNRTADEAGHMFSWIMKNGVVEFLDFQNGSSDAFVASNYWNLIDPNKPISIARLDELIPDWDGLKEYLDLH